MALDELRDDDQAFDTDGIKFLINNELFERVKPIKVDFVESPLGARFSIQSSLKPTKRGDCGSCSC